MSIAEFNDLMISKAPRETLEATVRAQLAEISQLMKANAAAHDEIERLRRMLFPYADATDISGMSWSGFYLIGDKKSISELKKIENRAAQLEIYRREFDNRVAAEKATVERLRAALELLKQNSQYEIDQGATMIDARYVLVTATQALEGSND